MNPITMIRGFFPSRLEQAQSLTTFVDEICKKDTISRGSLKRLERIFNATENCTLRQPNSESRRAAIMADVQDIHDRLVPNMRDSQSKVVMGAVTRIMLQRIRNWEFVACDHEWSQRTPTNPLHLSLKRLARPWDAAVKESAALNQAPPRWINERTMSLHDAFASKMSNSSVSDTTLNKLDAIFMRESRILLHVYADDEQPTLNAFDFGNARQPGFRNLAQMSAELEMIDTKLGLMEDSHAARSLQWKANVYKDHIEAAQQWWQRWESASGSGVDEHHPDFRDLKPSLDLANQARVRLGTPSDPTHR